VDHANHFLGLRLNDWTSLVVFVVAVAVLLVRQRGGADPVPAGSGGATPDEGGSGAARR
jgi:hypothetical protein